MTGISGSLAAELAVFCRALMMLYAGLTTAHVHLLSGPDDIPVVKQVSPLCYAWSQSTAGPPPSARAANYVTRARQLHVMRYLLVEHILVPQMLGDLIATFIEAHQQVYTGGGSSTSHIPDLYGMQELWGKLFCA
jgi:hypothetical protein